MSVLSKDTIKTIKQCFVRVDVLCDLFLSCTVYVILTTSLRKIYTISLVLLSLSALDKVCFIKYLFYKLGWIGPIYILKSDASVCTTVSASINPLPSDRLRCCDRYIRCQRSLAVKPLNSRPAMQTVRPIGRRWRRCEIQPASQPAQWHWQWASISLPMYDIGLQLLGVRDDS